MSWEDEIRSYYVQILEILKLKRVDAGIACWNLAGFWYLSGWLFVGLVWFFEDGKDERYLYILWL